MCWLQGGDTLVVEYTLMLDDAKCAYLKKVRVVVKEVITIENVNCIVQFLEQTQLLQDFAVEHVYVLIISAALELTSVVCVGIGGVDYSFVSVASIFRAALLANASYIVLAHNHPSGYCKPSEADSSVTDRVSKVGDLLSVKLLEHVVVGREGVYAIREKRFVGWEEC